MTDWESQAALSAVNQRSLQRLIRAVALSKGHFALILIRCNYRRLRKQILVHLRTLAAEMYLQEVVISPGTTTLHTAIAKELHTVQNATKVSPSGVMIFGLESNLGVEELLISINQGRDIYADIFSFPLVLWLQDEVATLLSRLAPDFKSWAATTIKFEMAKEDLITLIQEETEYLFSKILAAGADKFLTNAELNLDPSSQHRQEIESARNDLLRLYEVKLEPELEARLEFVLGRDCYVNDEIDNGLFHYQQSLALWLLAGEEDQEKYSFHQVVVLFHLGLCYLRMAELRPALSKTYWQDALSWFQQCLNLLETAQRKDLVAKFILPACEILQRLQAWEKLQKLAQESLELHEIYGTKAQVAQDYGFLAAVAGWQSNWILAYELANTALSIAEITPEVSRQQEARYLLLLGRSQIHLGQWQEAINNLEWARVVCEVQYDPSLYLEITEELRELYFFQNRDYAEAFALKQEKIQIEHQYGFRAFIGANQLQPQRYRINPILELQKVSFHAEEVAEEIAVSGRQQDINRLIERITRADCKLTIVHGPSGVGKSSILKAGLVPALKQKVIGERLPLPIVLYTYNDWLAGLAHSLNQAIVHTELSLVTNISANIIIEKLRLLAEKNYTIILVFDQFEELFFVNHSLQEKKEFYRFFSQCLNIPFVKVIISLREDYLHYLLEIERFSQYENDGSYDLRVINKDILDKDIRYYLGNFSLQDVSGIIQKLTERSHYEIPLELINKLVQDLAGETNEVHPIELQIVGAQLQSENITTLEEYESCGGYEKLVQRWLQEVIQDCGRENEQLSWQLLFELTDEKGTRPLKTKADLLAALVIDNGDNEKPLSATLELILDILIGSGLILRVREESGSRYQLVHDYLVESIRQKSSNGIVVELEKVRFEKTKAEVAQKVSQEQLTFILQRRLREARFAGLVLAIMAGSIGGLWWQADLQKTAALRETQLAHNSETNLKISGLAAASEALFASGKPFDSLVESLRAWRSLKYADTVQSDTKMRVGVALMQAVYGVKEQNRLEGHGDIVWGVTFSSDGNLLASGSTDKTVKVWRPDGTLLQTLTGHTDSVTNVSFSPDGKFLASASLDKTVKIWRKNSKTGFDPQPYKVFSVEDWVYSVNFSPNGQQLVTGTRDGNVKLWNVNGQLLKIFKGHQGWVNWVSFSPDGKLIASASDDKTVKIWRQDGSLLTTLTSHEKGVTCLAFSPDGQMFASASRDKTVKLWHIHGDSFDLVKTLQHNGTVWSVTFSGNSQQLASAGDDSLIKIWSVDGKLLKTFKGHNDTVTNLSFSPDNKLLASASYDKTIKLWSLLPSSLPILKGHQDRVLTIAWSPDGKMLASGSRDNTVKLWLREVTSRGIETQIYKTLLGHTQRVQSVNFDPKGKILASGSYDKTVKLWRRDGTLIKTLYGHNDAVMSVAFSPDGNLLASASKDKTIKIWTRDGQLLKTLLGHTGWVNSVSFNPDGRFIASASDDGTVKIWRRDGTLLKTFSPNGSWVLGVSFSPTDDLIASASWDNTVKLWRRDGTLLKTLLKGYSDSLNAVTFSPKGEVIAAASWDSTVKLWSHQGNLIKSLNGHQAAVLGVSFSPDGQTLASASADHTIILWDLDMHHLVVRACNWVGDYLQHNPNVETRDRTLCDSAKGQRF